MADQNECLDKINREIDNIADIEKMESKMFDALDFEGRIISEKVKLEMKITCFRSNRQARIASIKAQIWTELRQHEKDEDIDTENIETQKENNNLGPPNHRCHYNPPLNLQNTLPMENGCLWYCAANTSYHLTDNRCSEQSEILLNKEELKFPTSIPGFGTKNVEELTTHQDPFR